MEVWSQTSGCRRTLPSLPDHRTNHDGGMVDGRPVVCGGDRQTCRRCFTMFDDALT